MPTIWNHSELAMFPCFLCFLSVSPAFAVLFSSQCSKLSLQVWGVGIWLENYILDGTLFLALAAGVLSLNKLSSAESTPILFIVVSGCLTTWTCSWTCIQQTRVIYTQICIRSQKVEICITRWVSIKVVHFRHSKLLSCATISFRIVTKMFFCRFSKMTEVDFKLMSVEEVCEWLIDNKFPGAIATRFQGNIVCGNHFCWCKCDAQFWMNFGVYNLTNGNICVKW